MTLPEAGYYKANPLEWTVDQKDSGAVLVSIAWSAYERWSGQEWLSLSQPLAVYSHTTIVKKDGGANKRGIDQLVECGLWNADFDQFKDSPDASLVAILQLKHETYEGKEYVKVDWISPNAEVPSGRGLKEVTSEQLQDLKSKFGEVLRATRESGA